MTFRKCQSFLDSLVKSLANRYLISETSWSKLVSTIETSMLNSDLITWEDDSRREIFKCFHLRENNTGKFFASVLISQKSAIELQWAPLNGITDNRINRIMGLVCPMPSIGYPGTRVFDDFFQYLTTRVFGSSTRALVSLSSI